MHVSFLLKISQLLANLLQIDSGQSLNWQTKDLININE